jgi:competence protein ComGC
MKSHRHIKIFNDTRGFSTTLDILLFLVMISIAAVILLPTIIGNTQIKNEIEANNQKLSSEILLTLLNGRVDEFEYEVAGDQMDALAGPLNDSSVYLTAKKMITGKQSNHRTFSDLAAENAASQWVIYHDGKKMQMNFLMTNYSNSLQSNLESYLDRQIGDRYEYNFTVVWRPFVNVPIGGDVSIGEPVPKNTYAESTYITMPYHSDFSRKRVKGIIERSFNTTFGNMSATFAELKKNGTNMTLIEEEITRGIQGSLNETIDEACSEIVVSILEPVLDEGKTKMIEQVSNSLPAANDSLTEELNDRINEILEKEGAEIKETLSASLTSYLQEIAKQGINEMAEDEIRSFVPSIVDLYVNNAIKIENVQDRILTEVFSRISISRAQATLSIWERRT